MGWNDAVKGGSNETRGWSEEELEESLVGMLSELTILDFQCKSTIFRGEEKKIESRKFELKRGRREWGVFIMRIIIIIWKTRNYEEKKEEAKTCGLRNV